MAETIFEALAASAAAAPRNPLFCVPKGTSYAPLGFEWTYEDVLGRVERLAARFREAGYGPGHRVALLLGNRPDHFIYLFALNAVGASAVPVNPDHRQAELKYQFSHCRTALVVTLSRYASLMREVAAELGRPLPVYDAENGAEFLPAPPEPASSGPLGRETEAAVFYTSGTTGRPKGCLTTNDYWLSAGEWFCTLAEAGGVFSIAPGRDRLLNPMPVFHVHAGVVALMPMLLTQGCLIRPEHFSARRWWAEVTQSRASIVHYIGVVPQALLALEPNPVEREHRVRFGFGAGMEPAVHAMFESRFGLPHVEVWGMTEVGRWTANQSEPRPIGTRAIGRPLAPLEARVVDDSGEEAPRGAEGELVVRLAGDHPRRGFFAGYLDDDDATEASWRGGWFHSGDIVRQDESGMITFVDRKKNMIRRSGENIAPTEIETVLCSHPAVRQVAVLAVADERCGEEVFACVTLAEGHSPSADLARDAFEHCRRQLAYFKAPGWLLFVDRLPMTTTQKINRAEMFPAGEDPRIRPGTMDFRSLKRRG